ncbi:MAG: hypothetical protein F6K56_46110 [Moorea sp. SIO3G5]|nr:hypothetical protein [Moorena sp. SIO3G5]
MNYPDWLSEVADLLADPESSARIGAAHAIAYSANEQGVPLLRLRAKIGDQPEVLSEYLAALLKLAPEQSLKFVASYLHAPQPQTQELVALVLGESRLPEVFDILRSWWEKTVNPELHSTGLLAIAMIRDDKSFEFLLSIIADGTGPEAKNAIAALRLYRHDRLLWQRIREASEKRGDSNLLKLIDRD